MRQFSGATEGEVIDALRKECEELTFLLVAQRKYLDQALADASQLRTAARAVVEECAGDRPPSNGSIERLELAVASNVGHGGSHTHDDGTGPEPCACCMNTAALRAVLESVEWIHGDNVTLCPVCAMTDREGHLAGCRIAIALRTGV